MFMANFKNGSGDYMGMTGYSNDGAGFPGKVNSFMQNSLGLYNISGNVNEWVADIYRPMNTIDMDDFNPGQIGQLVKLLRFEGTLQSGRTGILRLF